MTRSRLTVLVALIAVALFANRVLAEAGNGQTSGPERAAHEEHDRTAGEHAALHDKHDRAQDHAAHNH